MDVTLLDRRMVYMLLIVWGICLIYRLRQDYASIARSIILKLLTSIVLALGVSVSSQFIQVCWERHALEILGLHYSVLLIYLASDQLLNNKPYASLIAHRQFPIAFVLITIGAALGALSDHNLAAFITDATFQPTPLYAASYLLNYGLQLCLIVYMLWLYWKSLDHYTALNYLVRRIICLLGLLIAACSLLAIESNLPLFFLGGGHIRLPVNQAAVVGEALALWLLFIGFTIPHEVMQRIVQPLEDALAWRQWLQHDLLFSLRERMVQIVPHVHLAYNELQDIRVLIEISDARQIIWSHIPSTRPITAREEARYLLGLLQHKIIFTAPGRYQPPTTRQRNVIKHNLAVAKHLKHYEQKGLIRSVPTVDLSLTFAQRVSEEVRSQGY